MYRTIATASALIAAVRAQQACTLTTETHPSLSWSKCTASSCTTVSGSVVVDANWRWTHTVNGSTNCYTGNEWDTSICTDGEVCAEECCVDGADYESTYGVTTSGDAISLQFVTQSSTTNVGSRLYLMEDEDTYQMFTLLGNEFTFDVDVSDLGCGLNGALYFVSMDEDGGLAKYDGNKAGAKYGTGYCDSQCPRDIKFIDGVGNVEDWVPSSNDANSGVGGMGSCCAEMDIWEANDISTAFTPHPCQNNAQHSCSGDDCGGTYSTTRYAGDCDPDGCDFNSYRMGNETFYGPGSDFTLDTTSKMTVVTQFIKGSDGDLSAIKRFYVQNGKVIPNSESTITGVSGNDVTSDFCTAQKTAFGDRDSFTANGGFSQMSAAVASPMVLVLSLWDDHYADMLWLDSTYPANETGAGTTRGTCSTDSGVPATIEASDPSASVIYSNIKFGPINSTFAADSTTGSSTTTTGDETTGDESSSAPAVAAATSSTKAVAVAKSTTSVAPVAVKSSTAAPVVVKSSTTPVAVKSSAAPVVVKSSTTPVAVAKTTSTTTTPAAAAATSAGSSSSGTAAHWGQCGGINWTGPTKCASGYTCTTMNPYYYQCV